MRQVILALILLLAACNDDCNREIQDVPYRGDATALTPYVETGGLDVQNQGCDETFCTYHLYVKVWLHNPWEEDSFTGAVKCEFWDDNYMLGDSVRENITINPRRSKELEFVEGYTTGFDAALSVECDIVTD